MDFLAPAQQRPLLPDMLIRRPNYEATAAQSPAATLAAVVQPTRQPRALPRLLDRHAQITITSNVDAGDGADVADGADADADAVAPPTPTLHTRSSAAIVRETFFQSLAPPPDDDPPTYSACESSCVVARPSKRPSHTSHTGTSSSVTGSPTS